MWDCSLISISAIVILLIANLTSGSIFSNVSLGTLDYVKQWYVKNSSFSLAVKWSSWQISLNQLLLHTDVFSILNIVFNIFVHLRLFFFILIPLPIFLGGKAPKHVVYSLFSKDDYFLEVYFWG